MIFSESDAASVARALVEADAVRLAEGTPFFYTSGWASPVYVDVHALLAEPARRRQLLDRMAEAVAPRVREQGIGAVVGTESSGIALAAWLAERLSLPLLTLRKRPIGWGVQAQLQGRLAPGCRTLLVDDVSTDGRSKNAAAAALRQTGAQVDDVLVLFDYAIYPQVPPASAPVALHALASWRHLHAALQQAGCLDDAALKMLAEFSASPIEWSVAHGGTGGGGMTPFDLLDRIGQATHDGLGITRESYGDGESAALTLLTQEAEAMGLAAEADRAGNLWLRIAADRRDEPAVVIGSHVDSVPQGGNYDGLAGVVAGIAVLQALARDWQSLPPLRVLALRGEESAWYGRAYVGSLALLGRLPAAALALRHRTGTGTLGEALAHCGADVAAIARGEPLLPGPVAAYLELHIEQGPVMVARHWPVAAVTGIRGNLRHNRVRCLGETGHSGAVPRWLRHDAVLAVAQLLARMDEHWRVLLQMGMDLVMTAGIFTTPAASHAVSVIPGEVQFSFEVRSQDAETLRRFHALLKQECETVAAERGVRFEFDEPVASAPATMDEGWIRRFEAAGAALGQPLERLPSGAGHDAAVFAAAGIPSAMLFVRNAHGSHNPHEALSADDLDAGIAVLRDAVASLRGGQPTAPALPVLLPAEAAP